MTWAALIFTPLVIALPGVDVLGVPPTHLRRPDPDADRTVAAPDVNSPLPRDARHLAASACCGVVITGVGHRGARCVLAHVVAGVITDPGSRTLGHWAGSLWLLLALWTIRAIAQWLQARLSQRGATAAIGDLNRAGADAP